MRLLSRRWPDPKAGTTANLIQEAVVLGESLSQNYASVDGN